MGRLFNGLLARVSWLTPGVVSALIVAQCWRDRNGSGDLNNQDMWVFCV